MLLQLVRETEMCARCPQHEASWARPRARAQVPVKSLGYAGEAAEGEQDQQGLGLLVDLRGAQVVHPALEDISAFFRAQADLRERHTLKVTQASSLRRNNVPDTRRVPGKQEGGLALLALPRGETDQQEQRSGCSDPGRDGGGCLHLMVDNTAPLPMRRNGIGG